MRRSEDFVTEAKIEDKKNNYLESYVDSLGKRIDSAKWKQNLVLMYNYMPLTIIQDKMTAKLSKQQKKYDQRYKQLEEKLNTKTIEHDMQLFKQFEQKLLSKMKQIQILIEQQEMHIGLLNLRVNDKRNVLKDLMKENMELGRMIYVQDEIKQAAERPIRLKKVQTQRKNISQPQTFRKISSRLSTRYSTKSSRLMEAKDNYGECVQAMVKALRKMQASEDVQQGIYLQIMKKKKPSLVGKYSLKSKICDTLIQRYGKKKLKANNKEEQQFYMQWETFKSLNWKQIMGIVLVRDKNAEKLKKLLQKF